MTNTTEVLFVSCTTPTAVVVTMGCGDVCPRRSGKRYEDWQLQDPTASRSRWCAIRDRIDRRVQQLLAELVPAST